TGLPVVAALDAAFQTGRLRRVVVDRTPGPAEIGAKVRTGPAIGDKRRVRGVGPALWVVGQISRLRRHDPASGDQCRGPQSNLAHYPYSITQLPKPRFGTPHGYEIPLFYERIYREF